jgi:hypothetical protein
MKIGDLVHDSANGMQGIVVGWLKIDRANVPGLWEVLYEDGKTDSALENEIEVISESR